MRFIGNKELITADILELLEEKNLTHRQLTLFDAFCGTGAVSVATQGAFNIIANDMLRCSTIYTKGRVCANICNFETLGFDPFEFLNSSSIISKSFFYNNYSPGASKRMYFTSENAGRIDYFRNQIEDWKETHLINENEYSYLLACLI